MLLIGDLGHLDGLRVGVIETIQQLAIQRCGVHTSLRHGVECQTVLGVGGKSLAKAPHVLGADPFLHMSLLR